MRVLTSGRFMVAPIRGAELNGHRAAIGYFDTLPDACEFAHTHGCSTSPVAVYDSYIVRGDEPIGVQEVHRTHGTPPCFPPRDPTDDPRARMMEGAGFDRY